MSYGNFCASCGERYYWVIDRDYLAEPGAQPGTNENAVGIRSTQPFPTLNRSKRFVMKDDDGVAYYSGRLAGGCGFEPLDDFGMPNAGATEIWINGVRV